jgi:sterol desaturase/sphingolipid hydroxylase (fatty acid hydroxylase superfamily)
VKPIARRPVLISDAPDSLDKQRHSRELRYIAMMSLRAVCLITGAVLASIRVPMLWLWLPLCGVGMVLLPWLAVLIANDRPVKAEHRWRHRPPEVHAPNALPDRPTGMTIEVDAADVAG